MKILPGTSCKLLVLLLVFAAALPTQSASTRYRDWQHTGTLYVLTTPDGADLPASASEHDYPVLVRLHRDFFNFSQAKTQGEDVRFASATGEPIAFEIDHWDAVAGSAGIWVRIPVVKGNTHQEIRMHWGKADARSASDGSAVFNASNGYLSVWHMGDTVRDDAGTLESKDTGTTPSSGIIGGSRHFPGGKGINAGEAITAYPIGAAPHSSGAWFRAEKPNATVLGWGNEKAQGKVVMQFVSPPRVRTDCYFSNGNVESGTRLATSRWFHAVHTYTSGDSRVYVNGILDGVNAHRAPPLAIESPARLYIGGWYNNYSFVGDIDEVRVSKVIRSADWVRLEYENQKPLQTLVGLLVQPGDDFSVSDREIRISEGMSATVSARAGGARKVYWVLRQGDRETTVAVDRFSFTLDAGRVSGDQSSTLRFKAVFADSVKTLDIPVTVKEAIPDPVFSLKAPASWDGRETTAVIPQISNVEEMRAKGVGELNYRWSVSGMAAIKEIAPGKLLLKRAMNSGALTIHLALSNGGEPVSSATTITVKEPPEDAWVRRTPGKDEKPEDNQFYARDDRHEGTLYYNGTLSNTADSVFLRVYAGSELFKTETRKLAADKAYAFAVKLEPGLIKYTIEFGHETGGIETTVHTVTNIVCGDAYIIDGQSNALATDTHEESPRETHDWIRSYAHPRFYREGELRNLWCNPVWKAKAEHKAELGWWGMELAKGLVESQKIPIFVVNGAVGGTRIDQHQRNEVNPTDVDTIYGRMLWRIREAKLTHGIRAVLWHQGENDQGAAGPDGGYGWESYQRYFVEMSAAWKRDFPNIQHYYIYQIWPNSCSMGNGNGDMLREVQRTLPRLYSNMDIMSTLGIKPPGPCHYPLSGWSRFAHTIQPLIERDVYGETVTVCITPPNLKQATYTSHVRDAIALEFDQPVVWHDALVNEFYLDGTRADVASGSVAGNVLTLRLNGAATAQAITYLKEMSWSQERLLIGKNGIAALTFCNVPVVLPQPAR